MNRVKGKVKSKYCTVESNNIFCTFINDWIITPLSFMNNTAFSTFSSHFKFTPHSPYTVYSAESSLQPTNRLYRGMWCEWTVTRTGKQEWSRTYSISLLMLLVIASSWLMGLGWLLTPMIVESADILVSGVYFWKKKSHYVCVSTPSPALPPF